MVVRKTDDEIRRMAEAGRLLAQLHEQLAAAVAPGVTTADLDDLAGTLIADWGAPESSQLMAVGEGHAKRFIVPVLRFGNVVLMPQPSRAAGEDHDKLYHAEDLAPHHRGGIGHGAVDETLGGDVLGLDEGVDPFFVAEISAVGSGERTVGLAFANAHESTAGGEIGPAEEEVALVGEALGCGKIIAVHASDEGSRGLLPGEVGRFDKSAVTLEKPDPGVGRRFFPHDGEGSVAGVVIDENDFQIR